MVGFVNYLITWLKPCFLPHFLWREQLSLLSHAPGCFRCRSSQRNNVYSSENISLARQVVIHQKRHTRYDLYVACLRDGYRRGLFRFDSGMLELDGGGGSGVLH